ncbi:MAG: 4Fe-4S dicluster domain-containing protein [Coriobacteriia bacterium]|nr:4Fe-4S dicluster domain-containing protein [Coriobacteriia bacterium]
MKRIYGWGMFRSMVIAYRNLFREKITVQYPHQKLTLPERARWAVEHKFYDDGDPKCTGCLICEKTCPDYVIEIRMTTAEDRSKHIDHWRYEIGACMMCGLCVEACPFDAIRMGHNYELARIDPATLVVDLLTDVPAAQPKKRAEAAAAAAPAPAATTDEPKGGGENA